MRPFTATNVPGLTSTAAAQPPEPPPVPDPYDEGYAAGIAEGERRAVAAVVAWLRLAAAGAPPERQRESVALVMAADIIGRFQHIADLAAPDPTADRAQVRALGNRP